ncbi:MAG TPA: hypothetical protein VNQ90_19655 [Chthoniobacteraceae bacterium]|nr:hypothetical protein [Chthoniobacteraceae bacterium]
MKALFPSHPWTARARVVVFAAICLLPLSGATRANAQTWTNNTTGTWNWGDGGNWEDENAPANPADEPVLFDPGAINLTVVLNTEGDQILRQGLELRQRTSVPGLVTMDLQGKKLILDGGALVLNANDSAKTPLTVAAFSSGTVQLGTTEKAADLLLGIEGMRNTANTKTMLFAAGSTLDTFHTANLLISTDGGSQSKNYALDLSAANLRSGEAEKTLAVTDTLSIAQSWVDTPTTDLRTKVGALKLGVVSTLAIGKDLIVGQYQRGETGGNSLTEVAGTFDFAAANPEPVSMTVGRDLRIGVGDRATGAILNAPATLHLAIGTEQTAVEDRGVIQIGYKNQSQGTVNPDGATSGSFVGGAEGGTFSAFVAELRIGQNTRAGGSATGLLDFRHATLEQMVITGDAVIGDGVNAAGSLHLNGGVVTSDNLVVGNVTGSETSLLSLDGTHWQVAGPLLVGGLGEIRLDIRNANGGIDLASDQAIDLTIQSGGLIRAQFHAPAGNETLWAIRMAGDQQERFQLYLDNDRLVAEGEYGSLATLFYDGVHTYYGIAAIPEPSVAALFGLIAGAIALGRVKANRKRG